MKPVEWVQTRNPFKAMLLLSRLVRKGCWIRASIGLFPGQRSTITWRER